MCDLDRFSKIQSHISHATNLGCPDNGGARIIEVWIREVPLYVPLKRVSIQKANALV